MEEELKKKQRAFIPINIITCAIALVAGLTLIFTPFLSIDAGALMDSIPQEESGGNSQDNGSLQANESDSQESNSDINLIMQLVLPTIDIKLSFTPFDFLSIAATENPIKGAVSTVLNDDLIEDALVKGMGAALVIYESLGDLQGIDEEELQELDIEELSAFVKTAEKDKNAAFEQFKDSVQTVAEKFDADVDVNAPEFKDAFDEVINKGTNPETDSFSLEYLLCTAIEEQANKEATTPVEFNSYSDVINYYLDEQIPTEGMPDPALFSMAFYIVAGLILVPAVLWLLLALLSGLHILLKNKTFLTWYVKLTGFFPCLIFGIMPLILGAVISNTTVSVLIGAISTMTWISGGCYLALVLLSWILIYPRRRKIRDLRRGLGK